MTTWYTFAVMALFLMGTQRFLYKVSAERKCNTAWTTFSFMGTVSFSSSIMFIVSGESVAETSVFLLVVFVNSSSFLVATITHIEGLKYIPTSVAYPIIRLNTVAVVIFSILYFKDHLSYYQVAGIVLAMGAIVLLTRELNAKKPSYENIRLGFIFVFISALSGAIATISSKFAAIHTNKMAFIALSYMLSTLFSFGLRKRLQTEETNTNQGDALVIGFVMGLINFAGYYSFLKALSSGPLSIIASITGMHFVIAVILSALVYKEKLPPLRILGISLTVISVILLRL
ncbi:MAG: DMT family transporter [Thermodesulfobacteriota bacterium]|nr:DMT family transporter [Thermodesulfobacteriota bacterium]